MKKLLVIRNDKLGDFMLIFPALRLIKKALPQIEITALVPAYTAPMAELCPDIDKVILDIKSNDKEAFCCLLTQLKAEKFDGVISFFSSWHNAKLAFLARIPVRFAPATKLFQWLYNKRLTQRRSLSLKPEYVYNLELAEAFLNAEKVSLPPLPTPPYLILPKEKIALQKQKLAQYLALNPNKKWIFLHCQGGGSAPTLSLTQYAELMSALLSQFDVHIILTAGSNENIYAEQLALQVGREDCVRVYAKNDGLADFTLSLACADLFISGSTGPLHICGALDIPTIAFYPAKRSASPLRWQTTNAPKKRLSFSPPVGKESEMDLSQINIANALIEIYPFVEKQFMTKENLSEK